MIDYRSEIEKLKLEKDALIVAHFYQPDEIQEIADVVGDSYFLSKVAMEAKQKVIVFCGVTFMAESAKILSPDKTVLLPTLEARCSMVELATKEEVEDWKLDYPNAKVVSYINSSTEVKAVSDACCTSANAMKIIENIEGDEIIFVPDRNLGGYIQEQIPNKKMILWNGFCCVHDRIKAENIVKLKSDIEGSPEILVHPECTKPVRDLADYIGSTGQMINYVGTSNAKEFIVVTEEGILYKLKEKYPDRKFYNPDIVCNPMKKTTLKDVYKTLLEGKNDILLDEEIRKQAFIALMKMHELGR